MSIWRARLRNTSNALTLGMSREQIRLQVSPRLIAVNSWIPQMIRQWILNYWLDDRKCTGPKGAALNSRNWQLMTSDRSQVLATSNFRDWHTVVGDIHVPWSSVPKTTMDCHSKLVLHSRGITSQCRSWCISGDRPRSYFQVPVTRRAAAFWTCCNLSMNFFGAEDKTELE